MPEGISIGDAFRITRDSGIENATGYSSIGEFLSKSIIPNILVIANIVLFFMILLSGFTIITNAGNADKQKQGIQTLTYSIIGFLIVFGTFWILDALEIIVGFEFFTIND